MIDKTLFSAYYDANDPFHMFARHKRAMMPEDLQEDGVLILWGGEDISPSLYNQDVGMARAGAKPSARDIIEKRLFEKAVEMGLPIIGICRGAQLSCALSGGSVYQHIEGGHHTDHSVKTEDGNILYTSSCHHQALNVNGTVNKVLAWDNERVTKVFTDVDEDKVIIPEVVYFPKTNCIAIQGHPEWLSPTNPFVRWCGNKIQTYIL